MSEQSEALKRCTAEFARRIIRLIDAIPTTAAGRRLAGQLVDAATSVAANYRATCRARSLTAQQVQWELDEARQLAAIMSASFRTARGRRN